MKNITYMSRIGKKPIVIPQGVKVEAREGLVFVEGPKGKLSRNLSDRIKLEIKDGQVILNRSSDTKIDKSLHGLFRALIANMVKGVSEGYSKGLEIVGVGFKAQARGEVLNMQLGYSHPVNFPIPQGIKVETPKPNQIVVSGIDKEKVGGTAMEIRMVFPPEPYKGKGIRFAGEYIKKKVGKAQATSKQ
ncbi:MAG: 50S ribosomal protein L6 [Candidatus Omnitrophota bacterium]